MLSLLPWLLGAIFWLGAAERPPVLLRVHLQAPEGAKGLATAPVALFNPPETIAIRSIPEVSEKEIMRISARPDGTLMVELDDFGATKLEIATSTGRGLILVVLVNGRVVYAPRIDATLTQGRLLLPAGAVLPEEIQFLNEQKGKERSQKLPELR